ncbi:PREDICTED: uncharacterized protein LOC107349095 isoform X2 [Acropora digitifera]|uniref:uncharacterized protein LOC107349095 isoform X1 n=1 Tax=Acropora digitifera TaxID=70779 RepID=UPI00077A59DB|nr:PREDICTED: uncharacterized protein LOC107349095 isoform X1 [Acropora digitifera]XP_015770675.1 PREDICTED: uncharacterized protein LOC107349095 isoform X2 [Acropora digitifera]
MSTVGYGDKTPKSFISRLFSVIWIMTGITVCSLLTATLSSTLTNEQVDYYGVLSGKKIGVVRNSIAVQKAVSLGAKTEVFEHIDEVRKALVSKSVDGMLVEIYTAMEFLETNENSSLSVAHFYEEKRGFGLAVTPLFKKILPWNCLKFVASVMKHNITVYTKHIHRFQDGRDETSSEETQETNNRHWQFFVKTVVCLSGITLVLLSFAVTRQCLRGRWVNRKMKDIEMGQQRTEISAQTSPWSWYESNLAFAVKQFFNRASILQKKLRKADSAIVKLSLDNVHSK